MTPKSENSLSLCKGGCLKDFAPSSKPDSPSRNALECGLPLEDLYVLAELESWRKEINRPVYHTHKWWATRLGSIFRAILLAGNLASDTDVWEAFYKCHDFRDCVVLDPFMGSGTTVGEAIKLGCRAVGVDINPVSYFQVKKALEPCDETALRAAFMRLEQEIAPKIRKFYRSSYCGVEADILYTFWVKVLSCPECGEKTRLFSKWIFSSNAYPQKKPLSWAVCPECGELHQVLYTATKTVCPECQHAYNPQVGPVSGSYFHCAGCGKQHKTIEVVRDFALPPRHEIYALMLLLPNGQKVYKRPDEKDTALYEEAACVLRESRLPIPKVAILPGNNTNQACNYNYRFWHEMFNDRQLLALGLLLEGILREPDSNVRENLLLLFSGTLEWNNMFCSFKGEGTGAVRPLFHHHILKPERTPLEANPWGTDKSSGAFSTLFERRLLAGKRYCENPFELRVLRQNGKITGEKVFGLSRPMTSTLAENFEEIASGAANVLLLSHDSSFLPLPSASVDLVITDPPYFDNVHYSELADFFFAWLKVGLGEHNDAFHPETSRSSREVQGKDAKEFGAMLGGVFKECVRVLKPNGTLAFTFQHAREEAWQAVAHALEIAGLTVVATHPVKAEMSVAVPKTQAKEPINLDLVIVCRPVVDTENGNLSGYRVSGVGCRNSHPIVEIVENGRHLIERYNACGVTLSRGDVRVILMGGFLKAHSAGLRGQEAVWREVLLTDVTKYIEPLYKEQMPVKTISPSSPQLELLGFEG